MRYMLLILSIITNYSLGFAYTNPMQFQLLRSFENGRVYMKFDLNGNEINPYGADKNYCLLQLESASLTLAQGQRFQQVQQNYNFEKGSFFAKPLQIFRYIGIDNNRNTLHITCQSDNTETFGFNQQVLNIILNQVGLF